MIFALLLIQEQVAIIWFHFYKINNWFRYWQIDDLHIYKIPRFYCFCFY